MTARGRTCKGFKGLLSGGNRHCNQRQEILFLSRARGRCWTASFVISGNELSRLAAPGGLLTTSIEIQLIMKAVDAASYDS